MEQLLKLKAQNIAKFGKRTKDIVHLRSSNERNDEGLIDLPSEMLSQEPAPTSIRRSRKRKNHDDNLKAHLLLELEQTQDTALEYFELATKSSIKSEILEETQVATKRKRRPNSLFIEDVNLGGMRAPRSNPSFDVFPDLSARRAQGSVHNSVPVDQFDPITGAVVHRYSSQREASIAMQTSHKTIARCCRGEIDTVRGFSYRFYRGPPINCRYMFLSMNC